MNYFLLVTVLILSTLLSSAQTSFEDSNNLDFSFFIQTYDTCNTSNEVSVVFEKNKIELVDQEYYLLNVMAYAKSLSKRGNHTKALEVLSQINGDIESASNYIIGEYNGVLGSISYSSENPIQAESYLLKSVFHLEKTNKKRDLQAKYTSLGMVATALNNYSKAREYYSKSLDFKKFGSKKSNLYLKLNMALTESSSGNYKDAKQYFLKALDLFKSTPDIYAEIRTYGNLGDIYLHQDSLLIAKDLYQKGLILAENNDFNLGAVRFSLSLSDVYVKLNKLDLAYAHRVIYDSLRSELELNEVAREMTSIEKQHELHLKNVQIDAEQERNIILIISVVILFLLVFFLTVQWKVLKQKNKVLLSKSNETGSSKKSIKILSNEQKLLIDNFEKLMKDQMFYKKTNFNLDRIAKKLNTNRTYLSEAINDCYLKGFSKWLNELRVNEALVLLSDPENDKYSIEGIANMVGFSSITTFNTNFKAITGLTPSYYRKNRLNN